MTRIEVTDRGAVVARESAYTPSSICEGGTFERPYQAPERPAPPRVEAPLAGTEAGDTPDVRGSSTGSAVERTLILREAAGSNPAPGSGSSSPAASTCLLCGGIGIEGNELGLTTLGYDFISDPFPAHRGCVQQYEYERAVDHMMREALEW